MEDRHDSERGRGVALPHPEHPTAEQTSLPSQSDLDGAYEHPDGLEIDPEDLRPRPWVFPDRRRIVLVGCILLTLGLIAILPPYISANRYERRIAQSVSESLGRPVYMDSASMTLLPMPGFTLENFVVMDDPAFSAEPVMQARSVRVTLRVWSLWRRRVEFSRISLTDPSVNLVHRADGQWNIESILLQAAKIEAAPTAQEVASDAPRFPYIEATGARVNMKMGLEKMPLALTEADLALWLPRPSEWRLRLEGHPTRTDTAPTDTGVVHVEGTLGKAEAIAEVPIDLQGEWRDAPLGGVGHVLLGRDAGFRGSMTVRTSVKGTIGHNLVDAQANLTEVRRADFVPAHPLAIDVRCQAEALGLFHRLEQVRCGWPSGALPVLPGTAAAPREGDAPAGLTLAGSFANAAEPESLNAHLLVHDVSASVLLDALRLGSARVSPELHGEGTISAEADCCQGSAGRGWAAAAGAVKVENARLATGGSRPFLVGENQGLETQSGETLAGSFAGETLQIETVAVDMGGDKPAEITARLDREGYSLHLSGLVRRERVLELARALPQFGDGLPEALPAPPPEGKAEGAMRVDLVSTRKWTGGQTWAVAVPKTGPPGHVGTRRRRQHR